MEPVLSPLWYRYAAIRPALRAHVDVRRQELGQRVSYVLQDRITGRHHRFGEEAFELVQRMDGRTRLDEIWAAASRRLGDALPTQGEAIRLLGQLLEADLVHCDDKRLAESLDLRRARSRRRKLVAKLVSPVSIRIPLFDPDRFVARTLPFVAPLFGRTGLMLWLVLVLIAGVLAAVQLPEIASNLSDRLFSLENVVQLWLLYPAIKALHELGHAYLIRHWGGEVHDLGVILLVFFPIPYVDASASMAFEQRHRRAMVAAIGVMVELAIAAIATVVWTLAEPGTLRGAAFSTMLIAGFSSLLFNGNPLMRYDAHYVLAESIRMPDLDKSAAARAREIAIHWLSGRAPATRFAAYSRAERAMLAVYAVLAFSYRTAVMVAIAYLMVGSIPFFGVLLAALVALGSLVMPVSRLVAAFAAERAPVPGQERRLRRGLAILSGIVILLFLVPVPLTTTVQGIVMPAEEAPVRAGTDGQVVEAFPVSGAQVEAGARLVRMQDDDTLTAAMLARARLDEVRAKIEGAVREPEVRDVLLEEAAFLERQSEQVAERIGELDVAARTSGRWLPAFEPTLVGRHFSRGELLGHVVDPGRLRLIAVVDEDRILPVRDRTVSVEALGATGDRAAHRVEVLRMMPTATHALPHPALTTEGGGRIARNPEAGDRLEAVRKFFWVELDVSALPAPCLDCRAEVRFSHPAEPIAFRWGRWARLQFLRLLED